MDDFDTYLMGQSPVRLAEEPPHICQHCRWWEQKSGGYHGICQRIVDPYGRESPTFTSQAWIWTNKQAELNTQSDFGCNQWQAK